MEPRECGTLPKDQQGNLSLNPEVPPVISQLHGDATSTENLTEELGTDNVGTYMSHMMQPLQDLGDAVNDACAAIDKVVSMLCEFFKSDESIMLIVDAVLAKIKGSHFREDVDPNLISPKHIESLCNSLIKLIINKQPVVLIGMVSHEKHRLDQTVQYMIENVTRKLAESTVLWSEYFQLQKDGMKQEITEEYNRQFATCEYQDHFGKAVTDPDKQAAIMIPLMMEKFFNVPGMTNERKKEVEAEVIAICESVYKELKVKAQSLKIWGDLRKQYVEEITKKGNQYITSVIGQILQDEIHDEARDITTIQRYFEKEVPIGHDVIGNERAEIIAEIKTVAERLSQVFTEISKLVQDIWNGNYGNGTDRRRRITAAGWDYDTAQRLVNRYYDAAKRVWRGDYGNGAERVRRLQAEGYDAKVVQFIVNRIRP